MEQGCSEMCGSPRSHSAAGTALSGVRHAVAATILRWVRRRVGRRCPRRAQGGGGARLDGDAWLLQPGRMWVGAKRAPGAMGASPAADKSKYLRAARLAGAAGDVRVRSLRGGLAAAHQTKPRLHRFRVSRVVASRRCAPRKLTRSLRGARTHAHRSLAAVPANSIRASTVRSQRRSLSCGANSAA